MRPELAVFPFVQGLGERGSARVIKTHSVDDGLIGNDAEDARERVAWLGVPSNAAELGESEAERLPSWQGGAVFVHASGKADGIGKRKPANGGGQRLRLEEGVDEVTEDWSS